MKKMGVVLFGLLLFGAGALFASDNRPIGVFDSGTGGLTVLEKMLTDDFAHEKFAYLGDQANMPYGDYAAAGKSDFLRGLVIKDAEFLLGKNAKVIVIACNTATAYGYDAVAQLLAKRGDGTRVIGVVNAGARSAIRRLDLLRYPQPCAIGVLATPGTISSGVYERTIKSELKKLGVTCEVQVFSRGCAGLADAVEAGLADAPKIACDNLKALLAEHQAKAPHLPLKAVILGCTHFPFVQRELETAAPKGVIFVDPAVDTAAECAAALKEQDRRTDAQTPIAVETYVSIAAPGLDPSKLDEKGGLTRAWKYGRTDAATDRSTVPVPILEATKGDPLKFIPFAHMIPRVRAFLEKVYGRPSHRPIRVACIGDSVTWGYAMTNRVVECYPAQLQRLLGDGYEVRNFGDSGSCVYSTPEKDQWGWCPHPWRTGKQGPAAYAYNPDIVVCNLGANDLACYMKEFTPRGDGKMERDRGLFVREYVDVLRAFARDGRMPRVIIWNRLVPFGKVHRFKGKPDPFVMRHDLERVAVEVGAETLDMYAPLLPYVETPHYAPDGCHPEGGAQRVIAEITARKILHKGGR